MLTRLRPGERLLVSGRGVVIEFVGHDGAGPLVRVESGAGATVEVVDPPRWPWPADVAAAAAGAN